jgi:two-component system, cell cycle sensor histidine kinase and response regulator CckA
MKTPTANGKPAPPRSIYVVDDEAMIVTLIEAILAPAGYQLRLFRDPEQVIKAFGDAKARPDLLITDFAMGAVNGLELIERVKKLHPALKTILVSGVTTEGMMRFAPVKPDRFLAKPFQSKSLLDVVQSVLGT